MAATDTAPPAGRTWENFGLLPDTIHLLAGKKNSN